MLSVRLCVCVCVCVCVCSLALSCASVRVCEGRKAGGKDQWRSVRMHSCRAPSSITGASRRSPRAHVCVCVCVCVNVCMHTRRSETGKIESAKALPYHQFTVPLFPFQRVCVSWCKSSLYMRCCRALSPLLQPTEVSLRQIFVLNE